MSISAWIFMFLVPSCFEHTRVLVCMMTSQSLIQNIRARVVVQEQKSTHRIARTHDEQLKMTLEH